MDNFGHDVAQKIKSAIKAKLVELDSYVDDELPDYIMVMVANKKAKSQMTEDLSLFLGDNTVKFVDWLHVVLERLQSVTLDGQRKLEPKITSYASISKTNLGDAVSTSGKGAGDLHNKVPSVSTARSPSTTEQDSLAAVVQENAEQEAQDEMLTIKAETYADDMLADELREDPPSTAAVAVEKYINPISPKKILSALSTPLSVPLRLTAAGDNSITHKTSHDSEKQPMNAEKINLYTAAVPPACPQPQPSQFPSRKRKALSSTVGAVVQREFPQELEDDEYDPRHPVIGTVASVIQVSRRKPSVPLEKQASKMLLLKAVDEAQKSILQSTQKNQQQASHVYHDLVPELFTKNFLERQKQLEQHEQKWRIKPSFETKKAPQPAPVMSSQVNGRNSSKANEDKQLSLVGEIAEAVELVKKEGKDEDDGEDMIMETEGAPSPESDVIVLEEDEIGSLDGGFSEDMPKESTTAPRHNRHVLMNNRVGKRPPSPKFIITLDGVDNNAFMSRINETQWIESNDSFVESNSLEITPDNDEFSQEDMESEPVYAMDTDTMNSDDMSMHHYDDYFEIESDESSIAFKKQKLNQTCRYWPSCKNGDKCSFIHPRARCKSFPNCKFGSHCLYIHPKCKYGDMCTRRNCPFKHTRRSLKVMPAAVQVPHLVPNLVRQPATPLAQQKIVCRNFPICNNVDCQYYHPKPCRYGHSCNRADCVFFHPPLPSIDKLKWKKGAGSQENSGPHPAAGLRKNLSDRKFAFEDVQQKMITPLTALKV